MTAVVDYGAGNLTSVVLAFKRLGENAVMTSDPSFAAEADRLVFPGVGSAASGMAGLRRTGMDSAILDFCAGGKPVFAICLGMQMLLDSSEEDGGVAGLGLVGGSVKRFSFPPERRVKVPHMGWNAVESSGHPVFAGIPEGTAFYFVHSYFAAPSNPARVAGVTEYAGCEFASAISKGNVFATQFHPERSGAAGLKMLRNFLEWDGSACC